MKAQDITGQRFGMLTILSRAGVSPDRQCLWNCRCDCGTETVVRGASMRRGKTGSCGCQGVARVKEVVRYHALHFRLRKQRGRAATHACVDCDQPAREWSYNKCDPEELVETVDGRVLRYSLNLSAYSPRCLRCHYRFDREAAA